MYTYTLNSLNVERSSYERDSDIRLMMLRVACIMVDDRSMNREYAAFTEW